jgi:autotransporter-associated beta strand protein
VLNNPPNVVNAAGTNVLNSPASIVIPSGGNLLTFESDSGFLSVSNGITAIGVGRDLVLKGAAAGEIVGAIDHTGANSEFIWKLDSGTWTLWGNNTPGATTTISNGTLVINGSMDTNPVVAMGGTLAGTVVFAGPVSVNAGATLAPSLGVSPSAPIGSMTINSNLTLSAGSFTALQLNKLAGTNDQIVGLTGVNYGGTLSVSNLAGSFAPGDIFPLFSSTSYSGAFASINPASPGAGLKWNLNYLAVDGTLRVISTNLNRPTITGTTVSGNSLVFSGTGGTSSGTFVILSSTNVSAPLATWTRVRTNVFDTGGNFAVTNKIGAAPGSLFYALQAQ